MNKPLDQVKLFESLTFEINRLRSITNTPKKLLKLKVGKWLLVYVLFLRSDSAFSSGQLLVIAKLILAMRLIK